MKNSPPAFQPSTTSRSSQLDRTVETDRTVGLDRLSTLPTGYLFPAASAARPDRIAAIARVQTSCSLLDAFRQPIANSPLYPPRLSS